MPETVRVTLAPGASYTVSPHPSGVSFMPPLVLHEGATVDVPAAEAEQLHRAGRILHPVTGQPRPIPSHAMTEPRVMISYGDGPQRPADGQDWVMDAERAEHAAGEAMRVRQNAEIDRRNAGIPPHDAIVQAGQPVPPPRREPDIYDAPDAGNVDHILFGPGRQR